MGDTGEVLAAGALVWRTGEAGPEVLVIHRPRYDDWSFPKGKLADGEHPLAAAVREVGEETGFHVRLARPLPAVRYQLSTGQSKTVYYWLATPTSEMPFVPNAEVDRIAWVPVAAAYDRLTHDWDRQLLHGFTPRPTTPLVVLRHAEATKRRRWSGPDADRPLTDSGRLQADRLIAVLSAYGVELVISSPARRCVDTVQPYADAHELTVRTEAGLTEESPQPRTLAVTRSLRTDLRPSVWCVHRPKLPILAEALGVEPFALAPGDLLVFHRPDSTAGDGYIATETHAAS